MSFHENLKEAMHISNISTRELAKITGISEGTLSNYLKTKGPMPPADKALALATALNVSVDFLVTGYQSSNTQNKVLEELYTFHKYSNLINAMEALPQQIKTSIENMVEEISNQYGKQNN